mgnify:CR=1 FL=1
MFTGDIREEIGLMSAICETTQKRTLCACVQGSYLDAYGYVNAFLMNVGIIDTPILWFINPTYMLPICMLVILWMSLGTGFLSFVAGLQGVDRSQFEAGYMDGIVWGAHKTPYRILGRDGWMIIILLIAIVGAVASSRKYKI